MPKTDRPYVVHGDWRDLRDALEASVPHWNDKTNEERRVIWDNAQALLAAYMPLKAKCANCGTVGSWSAAYRCADCNTVLCAQCIRPHFGPSHVSHVRPALDSSGALATDGAT